MHILFGLGGVINMKVGMQSANQSVEKEEFGTSKHPSLVTWPWNCFVTQERICFQTLKLYQINHEL